MTIPKLAALAREKLTKLFGKPKADQIERDVQQEFPTNGVKRAEALAVKAGIPIVASQPPTARQPRHVANPAPVASAELVRVSSELATAQAEVVRLKADLKAATEVSEMQISMRALEIAQTQGNVPPISFRSNPNPTAGPVSKYDEYKRIQKGNPLAGQEFWKQNKAAIIAELDSATA
jgi:hypothetical protein